MREYLESSIFLGRKKNAALSWILSGYMLVTTANILLDGNRLWSIFSLTVLGLILLPAIIRSNHLVMPPFEILLLLSVPFTLQGMELGFIASNTLNYITAATVSLLIITEIDTYTGFKTNTGFSVLLVTLSTLAVAALWSIARWIHDIYLGSSFINSNEVLMHEFTAALFAGIFAGLVFNTYFRRRDRRLKDV